MSKNLVWTYLAIPKSQMKKLLFATVNKAKKTILIGQEKTIDLKGI